MNKHPHEEVILAYYRGEQIEVFDLAHGSWQEWARYGTRNYATPKFNPEAKYRIKPQPPKTHMVELTQQEIEAVWCVTRMVGGWDINSARGHTSSTMRKLDGFIGPERQAKLHCWIVEHTKGAISFGGELPE